MAAVVRVKRRCDEEPLDAFILNCKRRKTDDSEQLGDGVSTVLQFAGTIENQEEDILKHIKKPTKTEAEEQFKKHVIDINEKLRQQTQTVSRNNRYKVVNLHRSTTGAKTDADQEPERELGVTIVDIENDDDEIKENDEKVLTNSQYVYDLYYTYSDDFSEVDINELISIYPLNDELVYGSRRDNGYAYVDSEDSEDSNAENNWRNDYPDESDMGSITEEDMLEAMRKVDLDGDNGLSSDDGEEGFVYSIDSEAAGFEEDIDPSDVRRYGEMYAKFKAKAKKIEEPSSVDHNFYYGDIDEQEYYY